MSRPSLDELRIERQPETTATRPVRLVAWILVIAAGLAALAYALWPVPVIEVRTAVASESGQRATGGGTVLNASGYVTARRQATVSSKFTGRVMEVMIEEGMDDPEINR